MSSRQRPTTIFHSTLNLKENFRQAKKIRWLNATLYIQIELKVFSCAGADETRRERLESLQHIAMSVRENIFLYTAHRLQTRCDVRWRRFPFHYFFLVVQSECRENCKALIWVPNLKCASTLGLFVTWCS